MAFRYWMVWIVFLLPLTGCGSANESVVEQAPVIALSQDSASLDPHVNDSSVVGFLARQIYDTLVYRDPVTYEIVPGLAASWQISDDELSYTFSLRQGVMFHDGTPFNALAVATNLDRIIQVEQNTRAKALLGSYYRYEILDDYTIRLFLDTPYSAFLDSLSQPYIAMASPTALNQYSTLRYQYYQVGTGPYQWVDAIPGQYVLLRLNPNYYGGGGFYGSVDNPLREVRVVFEPNAAMRTQGLLDGTYVVAQNILTADAVDLATNVGVQIFSFVRPGESVQFAVNTNLYPTDNAIVRQALVRGVNRAEIVDSIFEGFTTPAWGPLSTQSLFYDREMLQYSTYSLAFARELLESGGYSDSNNSGFYDFDGLDLEIKVFVESEVMSLDMVELLRQQWRTLGVESDFTIAPSLELSQIPLEDYHLIALPPSASVDPYILANMFSSTGEKNIFAYQNPNLDELLVEGVQASDVNVRAASYVRVQRLIMENVLSIPMVHVVDLYGVSTQLIGVEFDLNGHLLLATLQYQAD